MRISLTASFRHLPHFSEVYKTCDLVFAGAGYKEEAKEDLAKRYPGKVVFLKNVVDSNAILHFLKTGDYGTTSPEMRIEMNTIKATLPTEVELEIYAFHEIHNLRDPEKITLHEN